MTGTVTPEQRTAGARRRLIHLAGLGARTDATEREILAAAQHRLAQVQTDLETLRGRAVIDPAAGDRFQALTLESGQLAQVIARAQATVGPS